MKRIFSIISSAIVLTLLFALAGPVLANAQTVIPTISITAVDPGKTVTIRTNNFPANDVFDVYMNYYGTAGIGGTKVDTVNSGSGGTLTFTFTIPEKFKNERMVAIRLQSAKTGYYSFNWFNNPVPGVPNTGNPSVPSGTVPTFSIVSVDPGKTVTIRTANYPANDNFDVLMNKIGTLGIGGTKVQTVSSAAGGALDFTFNIPAALASERQIAIRLQSPTSGYFSYNWFWNTAATPGVPNTGNPGTIPVGTIPTISIVSVDPGKTVTVQTANYPANDNFDVLIGKIGTRGVNGTKVTTIASGTGGTQVFVINLPEALKNDPQLAIRFQSPTSGYFSYNWFSNPVPGVPTTGNPTVPSGTVPTFSIQSVVKDGTVTIVTANFPANDTFDVYFGQMGTRGVGGVKVTSVSSGTGGAQTFTFNIPDGLKGQSQIAVRLQSPTSGYFAYNWFWNTTAP